MYAANSLIFQYLLSFFLFGLLLMQSSVNSAPAKKPHAKPADSSEESGDSDKIRDARQFDGVGFGFGNFGGQFAAPTMSAMSQGQSSSMLRSSFSSMRQASSMDRSSFMQEQGDAGGIQKMQPFSI